jgi:hypothetical protein
MVHAYNAILFSACTSAADCVTTGTVPQCLNGFSVTPGPGLQKFLVPQCLNAWFLPNAILFSACMSNADCIITCTVPQCHNDFCVTGL